ARQKLSGRQRCPRRRKGQNPRSSAGLAAPGGRVRSYSSFFLTPTTKIAGLVDKTDRHLGMYARGISNARKNLKFERRPRRPTTSSRRVSEEKSTPYAFELEFTGTSRG